jgi:uncharacterized protein (TIGR02301 family)
MNSTHFRILMIVVSLGFTQAAMAQFFDDLFPDQRQEPQRLPRMRVAPQPKAPPPQQPAPQLADPPYQSRLDRLSEILGALHYLGPLCYPEEKSIWREQMLSLLDGENPTQTRRDRMTGAFNRAFSGFKENYRTCNPSAKLARERYREEGARLSRDLTSRFTD